jgi:hypoxanthine phosphoribosyltransferase
MKKRSKPSARKRSASRVARTPAGDTLRTVFTAQQLRRRVRELARQINRDYQGKTLHVVGIMENCFLFMGDLIRLLTVPVTCYFVRPEVYDTAPGGVPMREIKYTPPVDGAGKDVLLVDGILQSGLTLDHLYRYILGQNPSSVRTATLIEKTDERKVAVPTDYVGFKVAGKFLVGYGLGYQDKYRNLPCVARVG